MHFCKQTCTSIWKIVYIMRSVKLGDCCDSQYLDLQLGLWSGLGDLLGGVEWSDNDFVCDLSWLIFSHQHEVPRSYPLDPAATTSATKGGLITCERRESCALAPFRPFYDMKEYSRAVNSFCPHGHLSQKSLAVSIICHAGTSTPFTSNTRL